ncbi:MAG TPA: tetratricopeptide repeat protein [Acidobacteriota bacterium]|nr:tetratricopeptide repeat protein [Acidobacteriota bacterium]
MRALRPAPAALRPLLWVALMTGLLAAQDDPRSLFEKGNQHYRDAQYQQALQSYQQILERGYESGPLYYNIGNCNYKLGELGRAILNYRRAARLMPADEDLQANLRLVESLLADDIEPLPEFLPLRLLKAWVYLVPGRLLGPLTALLWVGAVAAFVLHLLARRPAVSLWGWRLALAAGALLLLLAPTLAAQRGDWLLPREGVVLSRQVEVQSAPSQDAGLRVFTIHEGTRFRIEQESGEWAEIVLPDGKVGWIPRTSFETV